MLIYQVQYFDDKKDLLQTIFLENILKIVWNFVLIVAIVFPYFSREKNAFWFEKFWD